MFPVGHLRSTGVSSPVVKDGHVISFLDPWQGGSRYICKTDITVYVGLIFVIMQLSAEIVRPAADSRPTASSVLLCQDSELAAE